MKILTLLNEKGGVGKTSLATHLAAGLAIAGARVLLVDADPQAHSTAMFGLPKEPRLFHLVCYPRNYSFQDTIQTIAGDYYTADGETPKGQLNVLATDYSARVIPQMVSDTHVIRKIFAKLNGVMDYVIFDTAPTPSLLHGSIYIATDELIYPTLPASLSFDGLVESIGRKDEANAVRVSEGLKEIKIAGIVPTMVDERTTVHQEAISQLEEYFGEYVWPKISRRTVWEQSAWARRVLFNYAPKTDSADEAWAIVNKVAAL